MDLLGIHHLTAVSAKIRDNHRFYTQSLGMRLVKRSLSSLIFAALCTKAKRCIPW